MKVEAEPEGSLPSHKNDGSAASQKGVIDLQSELGARAVPSEHCECSETQLNATVATSERACPLGCSSEDIGVASASRGGEIWGDMGRYGEV